MAKIENYKYTVEEAFRNCFYIVPDYQREYVWTDKEVLLLLDDIDEQVGSTTSEHFIGTVLVAPIEGQHNQFDVIDGQQRLTTFFLLLCALRNLLSGEDHHGLIGDILTTKRTTPEGNIEKRLKLEPRYENAGELVATIAEADAGPDDTRAAVRAANIPDFGSLDKLLNAYALLYRTLAGNDFYAVKQNLYKQSGNYLTRSLVELVAIGSNSTVTRINSKLKSFDEWTAGNIEERREKLQEIIKEIWNTTGLEI